MKSATRARGTSSFTWNGGDSRAAKRAPLSSQSRWPGFESNETSADDVSDAATDCDYDDDRHHQRKLRGTAVRASHESDLSDVGECDDRRFRSSPVKMAYDSDSCLTPRSRRTLRRTLSGSTEPWPSAKAPSKAPALDTIFSPTHEILHPLQSLRLERSLSRQTSDVGCEFPSRVCRTPATVDSSIPESPSRSNSARFKLSEPPQSNSRSNSARFKLPEPSRTNPGSGSARFKLPEPPQSDSATQPKPKSAPGRFDSYAFPRDSVEHDNYAFQNLQSSATITAEEEELEQKQSLIRDDGDGVDVTPLRAAAKEAILAPNVVAIIVDAEKKLTFDALDWAISVAVRPGDEIVIVGVLKHIFSPRGCKMVANPDPLYGVNREFLQLEVARTTESFESKVSESGRREECGKKQVKLSVRIAPGARVRTAVVRELRDVGATYAIFDRKAMRSRRYYAKHLSCHAVRMRRSGRATKTITLVPPKPSASDASSVSSMSTDRATTSSESSSSRSSPAFWRRLASFRSGRRRSSSSSSICSSAASPRRCSRVSVSQELPDFQAQDLSSSRANPLRLFPVPTDERSCAHKGTSLAAIPSAICAN